MIRLITALGLPLLLTGIFVLVEQVAPRADAMAVPSEPAEPALTIPLPASEPIEESESVTDHDAVEDAIDPWDGDPVVLEAQRILDGLTACADSGMAVIPDREIAALRDLLVRHPELRDLFLAARMDGSRRLRAFLLFAFCGVQDSVLRKDLLAACKADDPRSERLKAVLADTTLVVAVLSGTEDAQLRYDLIGRMSTSLIDDPRVFGELRVILDTETDVKITARAIKRLGKSGRDEVTGMLLAVLRDPGRPIEDRQAAVGALTRRPGPETTEALLSIVENRGADSLLRHAARGLRIAWEEPRATEALLGLLADERADKSARTSAVDSLVHSLRELPTELGSTLEGRIYNHLSALASRKGSEAIVVYGMSELSRAVGEPLRGNVLSIYESGANEELKQLFRADPALNRYLES